MNALPIVLSVLAWLAILAGALLGWQLLQQNGRLLLRLEEIEKRLHELEFGEGDEPEGLLIGSEAPDFELPDLAGDRRSLKEFRGHQLLVVLFNPACGFCRDLVPKLSEVARARSRGAPSSRSAEEQGSPLVLIISTGGAEANRELFREQSLGCLVLLQNDTEVASTYRAQGTPSGYLVSPEGRIASELTMGADALLELARGKPEIRNQEFEVDRSLGAPAPGNGDGRANRFGNRSLAKSRIKRDGLKAGTPAPDFRLPRLDGRGELGLEDLRGRRVLLVFSSPGCGPCIALAPQLEQFHREHPELEVLMISKGETKENRAKVKEHGLTFPVVLQQQWEISRLYAMFATPIAYLIDGAGIIVHDVAVGTDAIVGLMAKRNGDDNKPNRLERALST